MQEITSDPFLLEIARTLDENNIQKRVELAHFPKKQRLIAAFRALKQAGFSAERRGHLLPCLGQGIRRLSPTHAGYVQVSDEA